MKWTVAGHVHAKVCLRSGAASLSVLLLSLGVGSVPARDIHDLPISGSLQPTYTWDGPGLQQAFTWINLTNPVDLTHYEYCGLDMRIDPSSTFQTNADGTSGIGQFSLISITRHTNTDLSTSTLWDEVFSANPPISTVGQWVTYSGFPAAEQTNVVAFLLQLQGSGWTNDPVLGYGHTTLNIDNLRAFTPPPTVGISHSNPSQVNIKVYAFHGQSILLQTSADLVQWQTVVTNTMVSNTWDYAEIMDSIPTKFYRVEESAAP